MSLARLIVALAVLLLGASPALAQKRIALTFDDVPRQPGAFLTPDQRTEALIAALRRAQVPQVAFFLNPGQIADSEGGAARIRAYVAAGHLIANHSWDHPDLSDVSARAYLANIDRAEHWLKGRKGRRPWFRYPYLDEGRGDKAKRDAVRAGLAKRGLKDGYVTADGLDWAIEWACVQAMQAHKPIDMDALRDFYVETQIGAADYFDALAVKTLGRSPVHAMLMHETDLAALFIEDLVKALRADGWEIVSPDIAYADPVAAEAPRYDTPSAQGTLTEMLAWQKGLPAPRWYDRNDEKLLNRLFDARVLHQQGTAH